MGTYARLQLVISAPSLRVGTTNAASKTQRFGADFHLADLIRRIFEPKYMAEGTVDPRQSDPGVNPSMLNDEGSTSKGHALLPLNSLREIRTGPDEAPGGTMAFNLSVEAVVTVAGIPLIVTRFPDTLGAKFIPSI